MKDYFTFTAKFSPTRSETLEIPLWTPDTNPFLEEKGIELAEFFLEKMTGVNQIVQAIVYETRLYQNLQNDILAGMNSLQSIVKLELPTLAYKQMYEKIVKEILNTDDIWKYKGLQEGRNKDKYDSYEEYFRHIFNYKEVVDQYLEVYTPFLMLLSPDS